MMKEQKKTSLSKKIVASLLMMAVVLSGIVMTPGIVHAEENTGEIIETVDEIIYSSNYYSIKDYYSTKTAPVKENYVFGGWYQKVGEAFQALSATEASELADGICTCLCAWCESTECRGYKRKYDRENIC